MAIEDPELREAADLLAAGHSPEAVSLVMGINQYLLRELKVVDARDRPIEEALAREHPELEEWRPVAGFENDYEVSNYGRVRGKRGDLLQLKVNSKGKSATFNHRNYGKPRRTPMAVAVLVAEAFCGLPSMNRIERKARGIGVRHKNGNVFDNRADNLEVILTWKL